MTDNTLMLPDWLNEYDQKIAIAAKYRIAKRTADRDDKIAWSASKGYMTPEPTTFPKAELGICCPDVKEWWHPYFKHISHNLP